MAHHPVSVKQGIDWVLEFALEDDLGNPVILDDARLVVRLEEDSLDADLTLLPGAGLTIDGAEGLVQIHATDAETRALEPGLHVWELEAHETVSGRWVPLVEASDFLVKREVAW